ncbi:MAG: hypothetical protein ABII23_09365 [bacterium]
MRKFDGGGRGGARIQIIPCEIVVGRTVVKQFYRNLLFGINNLFNGMGNGKGLVKTLSARIEPM